MKRYLLVSLMAAIFALAATAGEPSTPKFDAPVYWVSGWNQPAFFVEDRSWDGVAYDGHLLYNAARDKEGNVYFFASPDKYTVEWRQEKGLKALSGNRYFVAKSVTSDPRLTNWWLSFSQDDFDTLWQAVGMASLSSYRGKERYPGITKAIIDHMVETGVVRRDEFAHMSPARIKKALADYTALVAPAPKTASK